MSLFAALLTIHIFTGVRHVATGSSLTTENSTCIPRLKGVIPSVTYGQIFFHLLN